MLDLVCAGEAFDDFVFYNLETLPAAGRELKTDRFVRTSGGGVVISSVTAARLGLRVRAIGGFSPEAVRDLRRERVAATNLRRRQEPMAVTVALSTRRDRRFITFTGMHAQLPTRARTAMRRVRSRHVHVAMHPGRCRAWLPLLARIRRQGATVSWDFGWNPDLSRDPCFARLVDALDYLFLNRDEARLYGCRARNGITVIKLGPDGCRAIGSGIALRSPAPRVRPLDTTGAGDVFNGAFLASRLAGATLERSLLVANREAGRSTRQAGGLA